MTATASVRSAALQFTDPAPGSSFITSFEVSIDGDLEQALPPDRILTGLTEGLSYSFRVRACNVWGCGEWSPDSNAVVPDAPTSVPDAIESVAAVPGDQSAALTFATPADGGSPTVSTEVLVDGGSASVLPANGVRSSVRVQAIRWLLNHHSGWIQCRPAVLVPPRNPRRDSAESRVADVPVGDTPDVA